MFQVLIWFKNQTVSKLKKLLKRWFHVIWQARKYKNGPAIETSVCSVELFLEPSTHWLSSNEIWWESIILDSDWTNANFDNLVLKTCLVLTRHKVSLNY